MTSPPANNPDTPTAAPAPSPALRVARIAIVIVLVIGVGVFGVIAIGTLSRPLPGPTEPAGFGASDGTLDRSNTITRLPGDIERTPENSLLGIIDSNQMVPIAHHPGKIQPFLGSASSLRPPQRQANIDREVWESCAYRVLDAKPEAAFAYYDAQAKQKGMRLESRGPISAQRTGGIRASWSDGVNRLQLTAWPTPGSPPPTAAPIRYETPLEWVVQYIYPVPPDIHRTPR